MTQVRDRTVVVTGASRGVGRALALRLAQEGATLVLVARDAAALAAVAQAVHALGATAHVVAADLTRADDVAALPDRIRAVAGAPTVVVHNAGIEPFVAFEEADLGVLPDVLAVNLTAPVVLTRAFVPDMLAAAEGHVVFLGSTSGLFAAPFAATYGATKAAVGCLARSLEVELGPRGVHATVIEPGFVTDTGMFDDTARARGLTPPAWLGGTTSDQVCEAIVRALRDHRVQVTVNSVPVSGLAAVGRIAPALGVRLVRALVAPFLRQLASGA
ncbi:MAG: SDR family NAD(P)-dependent oxidoreductase [Alphaproteobacteria bacterium]|nr:SDR family NAD(P)-dependent oxidoreductase [Alphaproteobacteria bacterium]